MKILIVVDMQNDFIDGALGTSEAITIVPTVKKIISSYHQNNNLVIYTQDTHQSNYLQTEEGHNLPVEHCLENTPGWQITSQLEVGNDLIITKNTFGAKDLPQAILNQLNKIDKDISDVTEITLIGLCTDICVISNALLLKAFFAQTKIAVISNGCAGVTPASHQNALQAMQACQINIKTV